MNQKLRGALSYFARVLLIIFVTYCINYIFPLKTIPFGILITLFILYITIVYIPFKKFKTEETKEFNDGAKIAKYTTLSITIILEIIMIIISILDHDKTSTFLWSLILGIFTAGTIYHLYKKERIKKEELINGTCFLTLIGSIILLIHSLKNLNDTKTICAIIILLTSIIIIITRIIRKNSNYKTITRITTIIIVLFLFWGIMGGAITSIQKENCSSDKAGFKCEIGFTKLCWIFEYKQCQSVITPKVKELFNSQNKT